MNNIKFTFVVALVLFTIGIVSEFSNFTISLVYWTITGCFGYLTYKNFRDNSDKEICKSLGFNENYLDDAE